MRRLARHVFTILSALSLLLCIAVCVLWVRDGDYVELDDMYRPSPIGWRRVQCYGGEMGFYALVIKSNPDGQEAIEFDTFISAPCWVLAAAFAVLPVSSCVLIIRTIINRRAPGLCPACGYDLRASPGRCPECGTESPHSAV